MLYFNAISLNLLLSIYSPTNENPVVYIPEGYYHKRATLRDEEQKDFCDVEQEAFIREPFDDEEVFDIIRGINDPEHPLTLEELQVTTVRL